MSIRDVFPVRLRALRKEIGISQEAFAQALGVARATLGYYEKGDRLPDIGFLDLVCDKTGCSIEFLMGYNENMKSEYNEACFDFHLSDKALDALFKADSYALEKFLEHPLFPEFVRSLDILSIKEIANNSLLSGSYYDFKLYEINLCIKEIVKDIHCPWGDELEQDTVQSIERIHALLDMELGYVGSMLSRIRANAAYTDDSRSEEVEKWAREWREKERVLAEADPVHRFYLRMTESVIKDDADKEG